MARPLVIGASPEVIEHHADLHPCVDAKAVEVACPCGNTVAIFCDECREPVFLALQPDREPCIHFRELLP